uniref:N-acetyltransferase domain-containing protein n=1 Tax=Psilocybe cubensis TaxID=181762 RepID=A0A8H8CFI1_PSICU
MSVPSTYSFEIFRLNQKPNQHPEQPVRMGKISVEQTLGLRHSVLWPDMPLSQVCLPEDSSGKHFGALLPHSDEPIAVISLFVEELPIDKNITSDVPPSAHEQEQQQVQQRMTYGHSADDAIDSKRPRIVVRFRKFACAPRYQGKGLGTQLLAYALSIARSELDATIAWCDARTSSALWYEKRGLRRFGKIFYKGPVEYVRMWIDLRDYPGRELSQPVKGRVSALVVAAVDNMKPELDASTH